MKIDTNQYNWTGKTLLLVEDDPTTCFLIKEYLSITHAQLLVADSKEEALSIYSNNDISLCLINIHLNNEIAFDIAGSIKAKNPQVPILFQTALTEIEANKKCKEHGFVDFINKPYTIEVFLHSLNKCLMKADVIKKLELCN
jgi:DNA-binding response OmpR family regulator